MPQTLLVVLAHPRDLDAWDELDAGRPACGGRVGAVLLSPCLKARTVTKTPFNHYSMLRSVEDNFGLSHLGYAGQKGLVPFGRAVLNKPSCRGRGY